jgi:branched-chain amino acid transport system permease protein
MIGAYEITLLTSVGIAVIFALSLNLITGFCGQISLGHAAFLGIGAYTATMFVQAGLPFTLGLLAGAAIAAVIGVIVGLASLRVRHDFLAITTMGIGFLFVGIVRQQDWLGGEMGLTGRPLASADKPAFLLTVLAIAAAITLFSLYIKRTWMGFAFDAVADDEDTARIVGIDVARFKLVAFAIGTALAGVAGALYARHIPFIGPDSFGFVESVTVLAMVVIGGIGSVPGVIIAAVLLTMLPQWFQFIDEYKLLVYGGLLFAVMRFAPGGLASLPKRLFRTGEKTA